MGLNTQFQNKIMYHDFDVNLFFIEKKIENMQEKTTDYGVITNIEITKKNAEKHATMVLSRWKIKN